MAASTNTLALIKSFDITKEQLGLMERYAMERKNNNGCDICCAEPKTIILSCGCTACLSCILFFFKQNLENGVGLPEKCINGLHSFDGFDEDFLIQTGAVEGLVKKFQQASFESKMNFFVCNYCGEISAVRDPKCNKKCPKCNIVVCAFCKEKWNSSKMKAQNYYCSKECTYYTYCTFGHTTFQSRPQETIPDRRFCPRCGLLGAYANKCKFHRCPKCNFYFCFFCLKEKGKCGNSSKENYNVRCEEAVQTFEQLWELHQPK